MNEEKSGKEVGKLYQSIVNAISRSDEVQKTLINIRNKQKVSTDNLVVLMIKVRAMAEAAEELRDATKDFKRVNEFTGSRYIDGKKLSGNEKDFYRFCEENFNEGEWLKELKLSF